MKQTATLAISPLSNPKDPEETNLPAIYCHNNLNGRQRHPEWHILLLLFLCSIIVTIWGAPTGLSFLLLFFQTSPFNNAMLLVAISVLHRELYTSYLQLLNSYQDCFP